MDATCIEPGTVVEITEGPDAGFRGFLDNVWTNEQGVTMFTVLRSLTDDDAGFWYVTGIKEV